MRGGAAAIAVLAAALGLLGPGCGEEGAQPGATLTVYLSVPVSGTEAGPAGEGRAVARGARAALADVGGRAGDFRVRLRVLDHTGGGGGWDPVVVADNARRATEDSSAIAYIGDLGAGPTRTSLPITNEAGILQVDPGVFGQFPTDPDRLRPSGEETFVPFACGGLVASGEEAMDFVLDAIATGGADRAAVIDAALASRRC